MRTVKFLIAMCLVCMHGINFAAISFSLYNRTKSGYKLFLFYKQHLAKGYTKVIQEIAPTDQVEVRIPTKATNISIDYVAVNDETAQKLDGRIFNVEDVNGKAEIPSLMKVLKD